MRIAVIADTHDRFPAGLAPLLVEADEIWHLGDVCRPELLEQLGLLRRPLRVVLGNNDFHPNWPPVLNLRRNGLRFHLVHIPPRKPPANCDVILHGHTHVPRNESIGGVRWLNPGCISRPNRGFGPSFAWLVLEKAHDFQWELVPL